MVSNGNADSLNERFVRSFCEKPLLSDIVALECGKNDCEKSVSDPELFVKAKHAPARKAGHL